MNDNLAIFAADVVKQYGKTAAVKQFDLALPKGCVCGLVGPNGAGKTSIIRMLLGLTKPTRGRMLIDGIDPTRDSLRLRQRVGYVPEQHFVHPWLRPPQVFAICAAAYPTWDRAECDRLVQRLGIPVKQRMQELSRGQQAKVALTIALSHHPQILVMDEPTSGLDPIVRREFLEMVGELIPQRRRTVLFSTHILSDIEHIADRIVVMNHGNVLADEPIEAMRSRYLQASLLFREPPVNHANVPEALRVDRSLREWVILFPPMPHERVYSIAAELGAQDCMIRPATLENAFPELLREPKP